MSAAPQHSHGPASRVSGRPRPKLVVRPRGYHHGCNRAEILAKYAKCKWAGRFLSLHLHRVASGCAQAAWIQFVYYHSSGSSFAKERNSEWSPVLLPEDAAKESGLSVQMMREARNECVAKGFTPRKSADPADGSDYSRYRLDFDKISKAPNAFSASEGAFVPRKPVQPELADEVGEEEANSADSETTSEQSRESRLSRDPLLLQPGKVAIAAKLAQPGDVEVTHSLPSAVTVTSSTCARGGVRIHLAPSSPTQSEPALPRVQPTASAGPGLAEKLATLGFPPDDDMVKRLKRDMRCHEDYFIAKVKERMERPGVTQALLPGILTDANEKWKNGGKKLFEDARRQATPAAKGNCPKCGARLMGSAFDGLCYDCHEGREGL